MKKIILMAFAMLMTATAVAETVYTRQVDDKKLEKTAQKWMKKGEWRNGFTAASPDKTVNAVDFYEQYSKNKAQWDQLFTWLAKTDLLALPAGRIPIEGSTLTASVEDSHNNPLEKCGTESHRQYIDFQYVVKGQERFGLLDHNSSKAVTDYVPDFIKYEYDPARTKFVLSSPDRFFLFFPSDWHIAKINNDTDDQNIRVIVVKMPYVE